MRVPQQNVPCHVLIATLLLLFTCTTVYTQQQEVIVRKDLLPNTKTSLPAAADSALRCAMSGLPAMGLQLLHAPIRSARGSGDMEALLVGLQASMYSELGLVDRAEALYGAQLSTLLQLPYAPYGACLRAHLALHHHRMGRREDAFNLITAAVRLAGDVTQCRAVASGRYHLGVLQTWEGHAEQALESFASAAHIIEVAPELDADAARYWAAYAETQHRLGKLEDADRAYRRAYTHALVDPVSRRRFARQIALQHSGLLLDLGDSERAADCLKAYTPAARDYADVLLTGMQELVEARLAQTRNESLIAQRHLRAALWSLHRTLTDDALPLTRTEGLLLRRQASEAVDFTFSTLLHDSLMVPDLLQAAWNTHLAQLAYRPVSHGNTSPAAVAASLTWLDKRVTWERSCFDPDVRHVAQSGGVWKESSALRAFAEALPSGCHGFVIKRFLDSRNDDKPCYVAVDVSPQSGMLPRLIWLDRTGTLERKLIPDWAQADLFADGPAAVVAECRKNLWEQVAVPLLQMVRAEESIVLIPDGVFCQFDPAVLFDPSSSTYLAEAHAVVTLLHVPSVWRTGTSGPLRLLRDSLLLREDSIQYQAPMFLPRTLDDDMHITGNVHAMDIGPTSTIFLAKSDFELSHGSPIHSGRILLDAICNAGASAVIHTLWPIPEAHTEEFHRYLQAEMERGPDLLLAYHAAQLRMKQAHPQPRIWGGYRLVMASLK